jgi:hypothetical protein
MQVSLSGYCYLFSEMVQYYQQRVNSISDLEKKVGRPSSLGVLPTTPVERLQRAQHVGYWGASAQKSSHQCRCMTYFAHQQSFLCRISLLLSTLAPFCPPHPIPHTLQAGPAHLPACLPAPCPNRVLATYRAEPPVANPHPRVAQTRLIVSPFSLSLSLSLSC